MDYWCVSSSKFREKYFNNGVSKKSITEAPACIYNKKDKLHSAFLSKHFKIKDFSIPFHLVPLLKVLWMQFLLALLMH